MNNLLNTYMKQENKRVYEMNELLKKDVVTRHQILNMYKEIFYI